MRLGEQDIEELRIEDEITLLTAKKKEQLEKAYSTFSSLRVLGDLCGEVISFLLLRLGCTR